MINLMLGDCLERMKELPDNSVDAIVTDPPYELTNSKRTVPAPDSNSPFSRHRMGVNGDIKPVKGFMGKEWDGTGIAHNKEIWSEVLRVLKPGGHLLSFGGTRTYHRMVCAVEDAGFEIRDTVMWVFGSGFPKSVNLGEGFGTAIKPAHEPIVLARKPLIGTLAKNVAEFGTGGLNIDGCRIAINPEIDDPRLGGNGDWSSDKMAKNVYAGGYSGERVGSSELGRFPANLIHDGSDEVISCFPDAKGQQGDLKNHTKIRCSPHGIYGAFPPAKDVLKRNDSGSAARFFYCAKASKKDRHEGCEHLEEKQYSHDGRDTSIDNAFQRNSSSSNSHPTVKPTDLMRYLCRLITPPQGIILDPFMGSGSTGKAAMLESFRFIGIEKEESYFEIAKARIYAAYEDDLI
jgi:site-specific DNA-methyltransferase (adenine-specific)